MSLPKNLPGRYDLVALVSNDLVTDQRMQKSLASLQGAGYDCLLLGRRRPHSAALDVGMPFDQERHALRADVGKRFYWQLNRAHYHRLLALRPRAILAVDLDTVWAAYRASRRLQVPFAFDAHELFEDQAEVARRPWIKAAWYALGRWCVPAAAAHYTVGQEIAAILSERYRRPFATVCNFPTAAPSVPVPQVLPKGANPFVILYQGALSEGRGLEELIEASLTLRDAEVWIVGDGPEGERLRAFAKTCHADRVRFLGELSPGALSELTPLAHLGYALMRKVSRNYYLSLSNKSIDYLRAGLPSLQMAWPEYSRIQETWNCYCLVDHLSVGTVTAAIAECREPMTYAELARASARAGAHLTWDSEAETLLQTLVPLLGAARNEP